MARRLAAHSRLTLWRARALGLADDGRAVEDGKCEFVRVSNRLVKPNG
jgi:hypothetical protein